ncbi:MULTISPECIES: MetQ/NlpA family ABC transporter substrate-binding protein [unclassified Treponema]|uniref:MetQ/NlpA family ABC transporter substrate-binding protein n=1 Tax=unclassified Treponema TaxID=2638727 RepID=UPI00053012FE|nr:MULTISPECIES: MetQ/NlpA family ABC transporter substrate-binding protein [unclassified Treponema]AIW88647.1 methionine ABC transporter substrate-binding protein [Treponema sp. OMZ 838]UTC51344.1 MetQ/NlpA family ABC transporter substrate-binding protein [Treponema sp. OMZ 855]
MKKLLTLLLGAALCASLSVSCAKKESSQNILTVAASPEPHKALLELVTEDLAKENITLKVTEFTDYVTPNDAVETGEQFANFFQHVPYMDTFNKEHGYHLVSVGTVHIEPLALYSKKYGNLSEFKSGDTIAIPNDPTNEARALLLLESAHIITLREGAGLAATPQDITANPYNLQFKEIEAATLPRVLADVQGAVINGNYAIPAGLSAAKDGLLVEGKDSPYANVISVKQGNENDPRIKALIKALQSDKVRKYITEKYPNGEVVAAF